MACSDRKLMIMRILVIHNRYQQAGGEDTVVHAERDLLVKNGHEVILLSCENNALEGLWEKIRTAVNVAYSNTWRERVRLEIDRTKPDIVHVHNFFPMITPSVYDACLDMGVHVVQTLHNYRTICPGALLMRDGKICEICIEHSPYWSSFFGCYRSSRIGTIFVARMVRNHLKKETWWRKVDRFIALTEFARQKFISAGFPAEKISVKPNFVSDPVFDHTIERGNAALFVGRLSVEKGIKTLIKACDIVDNRLNIAGDGPLVRHIQEVKGRGINYLGKLAQEHVYSEMRRAAFLIMPSEWYEGFPMVLTEAFALGLPVVVSRLGSMAEIVEDGFTGLHFEAGNHEDLAKKMQWMLSHPEDRIHMGKNARLVYEKSYTPEVNYYQLMNIYNSAMGGK